MSSKTYFPEPESYREFRETGPRPIVRDVIPSNVRGLLGVTLFMFISVVADDDSSDDNERAVGEHILVFLKRIPEYVSVVLLVSSILNRKTRWKYIYSSWHYVILDVFNV